MNMFFRRKRKAGESMLTHGLKLQEYLKKGMPSANPATLLVQPKMQLNSQSPEKIRLLINVDTKVTWIELLEKIDRVYPVEEVGAEGIIEDKGSKVDINFAASNSNSSNRNKSFGPSRGGGFANGRANGGRFHGECYRCQESGHRAFECPYGAAQNRNNDGNRSFGSGSSNYGQNNSNFENNGPK
jgi:hypothetical protein